MLLRQQMLVAQIALVVTACLVTCFVPTYGPLAIIAIAFAIIAPVQTGGDKTKMSSSSTQLYFFMAGWFIFFPVLIHFTSS